MAKASTAPTPQDDASAAPSGIPWLAIATSVVVPLTVAILGYFGKEIASAQQREIEEAKLRYSYVTLIVDILQKKTEKTDPNIVCWSWRNLSAHSKAPFTDAEIKGLCEAKASLPDDVQFGAAVTPSVSVLPSNQDMWRNAKLVDGSVARIKARVDRMVASKARYEAAVAATSVPWFAIAILHELETGGRFDVHLHNGDPLTARTVTVPVGRPADGTPPFSWEASAKDVLSLQRMDRVNWTEIGAVLDFFERYNGLGYRRRGIASPYLWGCTDVYRSGGYVADAAFDPRRVSTVCGVAAYLLYMKANAVIAADAFN